MRKKLDIGFFFYHEWLTGTSALSKGEDCEGIDMICLPELVIVVSECAKLTDGRYVCKLDNKTEFIDAFGYRSLSGTSRYLANQAARRLG